ncbi:hypothetical protein DRE_00098 [Drechslerella stenobrocha 248]|uniref:F-box domain-containing protein n=1 Tax=Drechslerella stenobrocha 248 TaxID=1043628 RepID=W7I8Z9_9PEZI|nr:hypothetical protein DRE_00098 [Drechslerella stenobrocha 248]
MSDPKPHNPHCTSQPGVLVLPIELQVEILSYLSFDEQVAAARAFSYWNTILLETTPLQLTRYSSNSLSRTTSRHRFERTQSQWNAMSLDTHMLFDTKSRSPRERLFCLSRNGIIERWGIFPDGGARQSLKIDDAKHAESLARWLQMTPNLHGSKSGGHDGGVTSGQAARARSDNEPYTSITARVNLVEKYPLIDITQSSFLDEPFLSPGQTRFFGEQHGEGLVPARLGLRVWREISIDPSAGTSFVASIFHFDTKIPLSRSTTVREFVTTVIQMTQERNKAPWADDHDEGNYVVKPEWVCERGHWVVRVVLYTLSPSTRQWVLNHQPSVEPRGE